MLKTSEWNVDDYLGDAESIFYYLEAELEIAQAPHTARALGDVVRVRGGYEKLAAETGVPSAELESCVTNQDVLDTRTVARVTEAFRPTRLQKASRVA